MTLLHVLLGVWQSLFASSKTNLKTQKKHHSRNLTSKTRKLRLIGKTPSANVYQAVYSTATTSKLVAVKSLRIEIFGNTEVQEILIRANVWVTLQHDNILIPIGFTDGFGPLPSIVYDWMPGGTLTSHLEKNSDSLSVLGRFNLIKQVAAGLSYLHYKNIIHGNLHGNNVLINVMGVAYLADYDVTPAHRGQHIPPSVRWAAPERFDSQNVVVPTTKSDVYSVGTIIYQILTSRVPYYEFRKGSKVSVQILDGNKPSRSHDAHITDHHWSFMEKCWSVPENRPSAAEVLHFSQTEVELLTT
ncbi:kinase-like domain-containing protein [Suillus discolor]|uniref:Kinase-like domain-containing protein n=1 Tax=Suillus discolor TaxID=1912936 RepID=A0A9P7F5X8_9AGAM|nr:kinase-like domain-containing protein [Suillus discolor]KAG2108012.1 kinase-like domain-containing protein [Suillus discolor]